MPFPIHKRPKLIALQYAEFEGNSLTADVIRERVKTHAPFLLTQMSKTGGHVDWKNTGVWKWLVAECPVSTLGYFR